MVVWYMMKPKHAVSKLERIGMLLPPLKLGATFQKTSKGTAAADRIKGPSVLSITSIGENGYVRTGKPMKAVFH